MKETSTHQFGEFVRLSYRDVGWRLVLWPLCPSQQEQKEKKKKKNGGLFTPDLARAAELWGNSFAVLSKG